MEMTTSQMIELAKANQLGQASALGVNYLHYTVTAPRIQTRTADLKPGMLVYEPCSGARGLHEIASVEPNGISDYLDVTYTSGRSATAREGLLWTRGHEDIN